jgi:purine-binding chemotaxis protein CheW
VSSTEKGWRHRAFASIKSGHLNRRETEAFGMVDFQESTAPTAMIDLLLFKLDDRAYALRLERVVRVAPLVDITPLPAAPTIVLGVVDVAGEIMPVLNIRQRFGLPAKQQRLKDALVMVKTAARTVALLVDQVKGTLRLPAASLFPTDAIVPGTRYFDSVTQLADGPVFIHDVDRFLSVAEETQLTEGLATRWGET